MPWKLWPDQIMVNISVIFYMLPLSFRGISDAACDIFMYHKLELEIILWNFIFAIFFLKSLSELEINCHSHFRWIKIDAFLSEFEFLFCFSVSLWCVCVCVNDLELARFFFDGNKKKIRKSDFLFHFD